MSIFIFEGEVKEEDQKQSILKQHLGLVRKTNSCLSEKPKSLWVLTCFENLIQKGFALFLNKSWNHPFSVFQAVKFHLFSET